MLWQASNKPTCHKRDQMPPSISVCRLSLLCLCRWIRLSDLIVSVIVTVEGYAAEAIKNK